MRMRRSTFVLAPVVLLALAPLIGACAAATAKGTLIGRYQAIEATLAAVDDGERLLCFGTRDLTAVPDPTHCTAGTPGLTDARHQEISRVLAAAFAAQVRLAPALKAYHAGDPAPTDLAVVTAAVRSVTSLAAAIDPSPAVTDWTNKIQAWSATVDAIAQSLGVTK